MTEVFLHAANPPRCAPGGPVHAVLYDGASHAGAPRVGGPVLKSVRRLTTKPDSAAFDFLTVALAVTAADTFVLRATDSDVGWGRELRVSVPLRSPDVWTDLTPTLKEALNFLTGDRWTLTFRHGGPHCPDQMEKGRLVDVGGIDSVSLFSGGLDSAMGVLGLLEEGLRPLLVSHSYPGDNGKQVAVRHAAFPGRPRFAAFVRTYWPELPTHDTTMRGRSFNFLALAAIAASAVASANGMGRVRLVVPENGFIAINAPLTRRRIGSLSTRTTHPNFLALMQELLDGLGIPARIENPYEFETKGEMVGRWKVSPGFTAWAAETVSCGKWKRRHVQCGRCLPCLIRRASFFAAGVGDPTPRYENPSLHVVLANGHPEARGDLLAVMGAVRLLTGGNLPARVGASGPLPTDPSSRARYEDVVRRGLTEVKAYLAHSGVPV